MLWHLLGKRTVLHASSISRCKQSGVGTVKSSPDSGYFSFIPMHQLGRMFKISVLGLPFPLLSPNSRAFYCPERWCRWLPHLLELLPLSFIATRLELVLCACLWSLLVLSRMSGLSSSMSWRLLQPRPTCGCPLGVLWQNRPGHPVLAWTKPLTASFSFAWIHPGQPLLGFSYSIFLLKHKMLIKVSFLGNIELTIQPPM